MELVKFKDMRTLILIPTLFLLSICFAQAQMIAGNDTLYLNYFIAVGEFGGNNEGLIIYSNNNELRAKGVRYNASSYGMPLKVDAIIDFYETNKNSYTVIKAEWVLGEKQRDYIAKILEEIKTRPVEENVYSNASEHYAILTKKESCVFIDRTGEWNKFFEIKKVLDIEQQHRNRKH